MMDDHIHYNTPLRHTSANLVAPGAPARAAAHTSTSTSTSGTASDPRLTALTRNYKKTLETNPQLEQYKSAVRRIDAIIKELNLD